MALTPPDVNINSDLRMTHESHEQTLNHDDPDFLYARLGSLGQFGVFSVRQYAEMGSDQ